MGKRGQTAGASLCFFHVLMKVRSCRTRIGSAAAQGLGTESVMLSIVRSVLAEGPQPECETAFEEIEPECKTALSIEALRECDTTVEIEPECKPALSTEQW